MEATVATLIRNQDYDKYIDLDFPVSSVCHQSLSELLRIGSKFSGWNLTKEIVGAAG